MATEKSTAACLYLAAALGSGTLILDPGDIVLADIPGLADMIALTVLPYFLAMLHRVSPFDTV